MPPSQCFVFALRLRRQAARRAAHTLCAHPLPWPVKVDKGHNGCKGVEEFLPEAAEWRGCATDPPGSTNDRTGRLVIRAESERRELSRAGMNSRAMLRFAPGK